MNGKTKLAIATSTLGLFLAARTFAAPPTQGGPSPVFDCTYIAISACEGNVSVEGLSNGVLLTVWQSADQDMVTFHFLQGRTELRITGRNMASPLAASFAVSAHSKEGTAAAEFTPAQFAQGDFSIVEPVLGALPASFLSNARAALVGLPDSTTGLSGIKRLGIAVLDAIGHSREQQTGAGERPQMAGIFYASCYWGCVIGGGGWGDCGDYCYHKYGTN